MTDRIGFYLDDGVDPIVSRSLQVYGVRVLAPTDLDRRDSADLELLMLACQKQLAIVTHDLALLNLAREQVGHFGLVYCDHDLPGTSELIRRLLLVYEALTIDDLLGRIEIF